MIKKEKNQPSVKDLIKWGEVRNDLCDHLYTGLTGRFQIWGHVEIGKWSKKYEDKIILDVGCGHGHHLSYSGNSYKQYLGLDLEWNFCKTCQERYSISTVNGDAYRLPIKDKSVDCVISVYNFEHLKQLLNCLEEIRRVIKPQGELLIGLPAEGGFLYSLGRNLTSKPYMEKKYGIDYDAIVHYEHCNTYQDVITALKKSFKISTYRYIPFPFFHSVHLNAVICLKAIPLS
jgi:SAM-dependent methyltransferase